MEIFWFGVVAFLVVGAIAVGRSGRPPTEEERRRRLEERERNRSAPDGVDASDYDSGGSND